MVEQPLLQQPLLTITIDQRPGGWHAQLAWAPIGGIQRGTEIYGEPTLGDLADAIRDVLEQESES